MGKNKNKNKNKQASEAIQAEKKEAEVAEVEVKETTPDVDTPADTKADAEMSSQSLTEKEASDSDASMKKEDSPSEDMIGPELPPGFEAEEVPEEEKKESEKTEEKTEGEPEEKKAGEGAENIEGSEQDPGMVSNAYNGAKNVANTLFSAVFGANAVEKKDAPVKKLANGEFDPDELTKAEEHKAQGNDYFKDGKYDKALEAYSNAIYCSVPSKNKAVYYCNRALVSIKTENYALALFDAKDALKCDEMYVKAYYRRGSAHLALNQIDAALKDFRTVCKMQPNNKDARNKYDETVKEQRLRQFQEAMGYDDEKVKVNLDEITVEAGYTGPKLEKSTDEITPEWVKSVMQWQKDRKVLHKKFATMIIMKAKELFEKAKSCVEIQRGDEEEITVCGDIHGQYYDLLNIFELNGVPSEANPYLFNGDFIDRGSFSVEVIVTMLAWKVCYPNHFFMSRGNHETKQLNKLYGFYGEVVHKYDNKTYELFNDLFQHLPLCHTINKKVFVTHGGLFTKDGVTIDEIKKTPRFKEPADEGIMVDCLWSDPTDMPGRLPSKRGISCMFGPDVTQKFLEKNNLELVVRSHEVKHEGYEYQKGGKCLTVFSAPNYCDQMGNKGAFIRFKGGDMKPQITSFDKVDHPKIPPMAYANRFGSLF